MRKIVLIVMLLLHTITVRAAIFVVTNTANSGPGSLRQAIINVNADGTTPRVINFAIASGVQTIQPLTALPAITVSDVLIDGSTQPGWSAGNPVIVIDGTSAAFGFDGLTISGANSCTIQDLVVNNGFNSGITINGNANNNAVYGCFLGINQAGTAAAPNSLGITVVATTGQENNGTIIGAPNRGNVLSGNAGLLGAGAFLSGNLNDLVFQGNFVGTDKTGMSAVGNAAAGAAIISQPTSTTALCSGATIGGSGAGEGNIFSGNSTGPGLFMGFQNVQNTVIQGNYMGVDATGAAALPNGVGLVTFTDNPVTFINGTIFGGGNAGEGNVVSANPGGGVGFQVNCNNNIIKGNFIGTDITGTIALGNGGGLFIQGNNNQVGGLTAAERNIISNNNGSGIGFSFGSSNNTVVGNYIGVDVTGAVAMGNTNNGIEISGFDFSTSTLLSPSSPLLSAAVLPSPLNAVVSSNNNIIGGTVSGARNIIANCGSSGISLNLGCNNTVIQGNYIGVDVTGTVAMNNGNNGIEVGGYNFGSQTPALSNNTLIGGSVAQARNIISNNSSSGIFINAGCSDSIIRGNYIGTDVTGLVNFGNGNVGIQITGYDYTNQVLIPSNGTIIGGSTAIERNVIVASTNQGIQLNAGVNNTVITGNYIGVDSTGATALANGNVGVQISGYDFTNHVNVGSNDTIIGGAAAGQRNIISGNGNAGIQFNVGVDSTIIKGNYIGVDVTGLVAIPNNQMGIQIDGYDFGIQTVVGSNNTVIGGAATGERNIISGNNNIGIQLNLGVDNTEIKGNYIGVDATGIAALPNNNAGIQAFGFDFNPPGTPAPCLNTIIGGAAAGERNIISGNNGSGIDLGNGVNSSIIKGNYLGIGSDGLTSLGNTNHGIHIFGAIQVASNDTVIGGPLAGEGNVIGNNTVDGIWLDTNVHNSIVQGNFIGTDSSATINFGNGNDGIQISGQNGAPCTNNLIGGLLQSQKNIIKFNNTFGVNIGGDVTTPDVLNSVLGNPIYLNGNNGISLHDGGNNMQEPPTLNTVDLCATNNLIIISATAPLTPAATAYRLEFFFNSINRNPITEGAQFISAVSPISSGDTVTQSFPFSGASVGQWVSATATNLNNVGGTVGDTSEFSLNKDIAASNAPVLDLSGTPTLVCAGDPVTLNLLITGLGQYDLLWSDGFVQTNVTSPVQRIVFPLTTTIYDVVATDTFGCTGISNDTTITVSTPSVTLSANPIIVPLGGMSTLTATPSGNSPFTLIWSDGLVQTGVTGVVTRQVQITTPILYSVTVVDAIGCFYGPVSVFVSPGRLSPIARAIFDKYCS